MKKKLLIVASVLLATFIAINIAAFYRQLNKVQEMPVTLPSSSVSNDTLHRAEVVVLSADSCTVNGTNMSIRDLGDRLVSAKTQAVYLRAGRSVSPEAVIPFLDVVRRTGIQQISLETAVR